MSRRAERKPALGTRAPMVLPLMPSQRWSLDFASEQLPDGRLFRILTVVEHDTQECLALIADTSLSGARVAREVAALYRRPRQARDGGQRQRPLPHGIPEPALVHDPCRRRRKTGGLVCILPRGTATWRDRERDPDHADAIGGHHQPVTLIEAGKLSLRAVRGWRAAHEVVRQHRQTVRIRVPAPQKATPSGRRPDQDPQQFPGR